LQRKWGQGKAHGKRKRGKSRWAMFHIQKNIEGNVTQKIGTRKFGE